MFKRKLKDLFVGILIGCILTSTTPVLANTILQKIDVVLNGVNVEVNGKNLDSNSILYNGLTYLPLRKVAKAVGKDVEWNQLTMTANIVDKEINISDGVKMETLNNDIYYQEFIKMFNVGETFTHEDINDVPYYLNRCVYNGNLSDEEFHVWINQQKDNLNSYLTYTLSDVFPNPEKTSKISLEKIKDNGQSFFIGNATFDINTKQITVNINQDIK